MIKSITGLGKYVVVSGGSSYSPYMSTSTGAQGVGNVRYNPSAGQLEVYDGNVWQMLGSSLSSVGLTTEAESLLDWASRKRAEEQVLERMAETNVTIAGLLQEKKTLEDKIKMIEILSREEPKLGTS